MRVVRSFPAPAPDRAEALTDARLPHSPPRCGSGPEVPLPKLTC